MKSFCNFLYSATCDLLLKIDKSVGQRIQEEMCLDYLLKLTTRQGQLWTKEQYADRILDGK